MMTNHTPGPWYTGAPEWPNKVYSQERHAVAMVECNYMNGDKEDIANAQLIAAAPETASQRDDLLDAMWDIYHHAYDPETPREDLEADFDRMRDIAYAAITKANGGE